MSKVYSGLVERWPDGVYEAVTEIPYEHPVTIVKQSASVLYLCMDDTMRVIAHPMDKVYIGKYRKCA